MAQRLLDPRRDQRDVVEHLRLLRGVRRQVEERVAEELGGGLVAGDDHEEQEGHDLAVGEPVAVHLRGDQRRGQVVGRGTAALGHHLAVVAEEREGRLHAGLRYVADAVLTVHDQVGEASYLVAVGHRHAHHLGDDVHRELAGEVVDPVGLAALGVGGEGALEVALGQRLHLRRQLADPARREGRGDQLADPRLLGAVEAEEAHHPVRFGVPRGRVERDAHPVGEHRVVAQHVEDVLVTRDHPDVVGGRVEDRRLVPQALVRRVRVVLEGVVVGVEDQLAGGAGGHQLPRRMTSAAETRRSAISS